MVEPTTVEAVNRMTAAWVREAAYQGDGGVLTSVGVWPLLALIAGAADGPARDELAAALGVPADVAAAAGRELLTDLDGMPGVRTAAGLWARRTLPLREEWLATLPLDCHGEITGDADADRKVMDEWAVRRTDGMVPQMPVDLAPGTLLVLASALLAQTTWKHPFTEIPLLVVDGPWRERPLAGLHRYSSLTDELAVHATPYGPVTRLRVEGDNGIDVHLLRGADGRTSREVLAAGVDALTGRYETVAGDALPHGTPGPGVHVSTVPSWDSTPALVTTAVAFTVSSDHDLLTKAQLFGLETARDDQRGHFPGISDFPLCVSQARQAATASFSALGFRAAAVTALTMEAGGAPVTPPDQAKLARVGFDRPFGFLAVDTASGLVLAAGWVAQPEPGAS